MTFQDGAELADLDRQITGLRDSIGQHVAKAGEVGSQIGPGSQTLSVYMLGFGLVVLVLMTYLIGVKDKGGETLLRSFGVTLIITAAVLLVVAGYSQDQIAPVIGLLGTIAGFLLGKIPEARRPASGKTVETPPDDTKA
jgi:hypothetical protein